MAEPRGLAVPVLEHLGITYERVRTQVGRPVVTAARSASGPTNFTPRAKRALELARREARSMGYHYVGTEHILLGLACVTDGVGARILLDFGADLEKLRSEVM